MPVVRENLRARSSQTLQDCSGAIQARPPALPATKFFNFNVKVDTTPTSLGALLKTAYGATPTINALVGDSSIYSFREVSLQGTETAVTYVWGSSLDTLSTSAVIATRSGTLIENDITKTSVTKISPTLTTLDNIIILASGASRLIGMVIMDTLE